MNSNTEEFGNLLSTIYIYQLMGSWSESTQIVKLKLGKNFKNFVTNLEKMKNVVLKIWIFSDGILLSFCGTL